MKYTVIPKPAIGPADNEIWYTTSDGGVAEFNPYDVRTGNYYNRVISNTYTNGKGVIKFENPLTEFIGYFNYDVGYIQSANFWNHDYTISYNDKLTSLVLPNCVLTLGAFPFSGLYNINEIIIPNSVTKLESQTFSNENPKSYKYDGTVEMWDSITKEQGYNIALGDQLPVTCIDGTAIIPWG